MMKLMVKSEMLIFSLPASDLFFFISSTSIHSSLTESYFSALLRWLLLPLRPPATYKQPPKDETAEKENMKKTLLSLYSMLLLSLF